jgi:hypothetical protein
MNIKTNLYRLHHLYQNLDHVPETREPFDLVVPQEILDSIGQDQEHQEGLSTMLREGFLFLAR